MERIEDKENGNRCFIMIINLILILFDVWWSIKCNDSEKFLLIDVNVEVYKELIVFFFYLVLVV